MKVIDKTNNNAYNNKNEREKGEKQEMTMLSAKSLVAVYIYIYRAFYQECTSKVCLAVTLFIGSFALVKHALNKLKHKYKWQPILE